MSDKCPVDPVAVYLFMARRLAPLRLDLGLGWAVAFDLKAGRVEPVPAWLQAEWFKT